MRLFLIIVLFFLSGCISLHLGPQKAEKSAAVHFIVPPPPFQKIHAPAADMAWQNGKNGNSISFLSTCNDPADPSLEFVQQELLSGLREAKVVRSETRSYNSRAALFSEVEGLLDGVKTHIELLVFKKNNCIYSLTYVGVDHAFSTDRSSFNAFLEGFKAP